MSNKYYWHSRISERKFRHVVQCFAEDKTAAKTAEETGLNRKSINNIFLRIRRRILESSLANTRLLPVKDFRIRDPYFVAESEAECKKYSAKYKSRVLVALFEGGRMSSHIIYAELDRVFIDIQRLPSFYLKDWEVSSLELFEIIDKPIRVENWNAHTYSQIHMKNYCRNLLIYFFRRIKQFRGTYWEKFILHLKETEWRYNKIVGDENIKEGFKTLEEKDLSNLISKTLYHELLEILRKNPL